jgi:glycosyltransferase involved in cell wall biosynthesis
VLDKFNLDKIPYILTVGSHAFHKNLSVVYRAAEMIPSDALNIVVVGGDFDRWFKSTGELSTDKVKKIGYISDSELKALYQNAIALVFPSLYEGFGLPPLEAMACGCPVIVSKSSSLPEVCGDAVLYFDPHQPQELVEKINKVINNPGLRSELRGKGFSQAEKFHWSVAAKTTWESLVKYLG